MVLKNRVGNNVNVSYINSQNVKNAAQLAKECDVAIVFGGVFSSEGSDRNNLNLAGNADTLIPAIQEAQPNTVVVLHVAGAVTMPWVDKVSSIVLGGMPGQESGNALASVLFGDYNPSGKLPITFPKSISEIPVNTVEQYPGIENEAIYSEKLLVGYRWYDAKNVEPLFPFGHGLSYTQFGYHDLTMSGHINSNLRITFNIKNIGSRDGFEVAQLYLGFPSSSGEPPKQLKGFDKIHLNAGEDREVAFHVKLEDISIWDITKHDYVPVKGNFNVYIGSSSRDIRLTGMFTY